MRDINVRYYLRCFRELRFFCCFRDLRCLRREPPKPNNDNILNPFGFGRFFSDCGPKLIEAFRLSFSARFLAAAFFSICSIFFLP